MRRTGAVIIIALAILPLCGCVPVIPFRTGKQIREEQVKAITPGSTTKSELFERFGAPTAVVVRDEVTAITSPSAWSAPLQNRFDYSFDANTFFELFPTTRESNEYHRVYYYHYVVSSKVGYILILGLYESGKTKTDRLWVLVNEKMGTVEDYAFKKHGEKVLFGMSRGVSRSEESKSQ
jgi:hypothetical protein